MLEVDSLAGPVLHRPRHVLQAGHSSVMHGLGVQTLDIRAVFGKLFQEELSMFVTPSTGLHYYKSL